MMTRYSAWLDGIGLHDISPKLYIMDIEESYPDVNVLTASNAGRDGLRVTNRRRQSLTVVIRFMVHEYDTVARKNIFQQIGAWAKGKYLTISDRPGQRLRVHCDRVPTAQSALKWTGTQSITFTAYEKPYWEAETALTAARTGSSGSLPMTPPGTAETCFLGFTAVNNTSSALSFIRVKAGDTVITLSDMNIPAGDSVSVEYDDEGVLHLPLSARTADSSDDLLLICGETNTVSFTADQAVSITFTTRGRYE